MNKSLPLLGAALGLALLITGCESDNSSRIQEKSAVYATLKPWQKKNIDAGIVAMTFTPDMVYMAIGNPTTKTPTTDGGELWTYKNYYPSTGAANVKYTLNSAGNGSNTAGSTRTESNGKGGQQVAGSSQGGAGQSASATGGPQGGSMEPADLASYTLYVTFQNGVVGKLKLDPN
jgi:uncharacterized membrane protein YgcG